MSHAVPVRSSDSGGAGAPERRRREGRHHLEWNPDVMITTDVKMKDTLASDSLYSDVSAVKNRTIYYIPTVAHVWGNRTVKQPLTVF